VKDDPGHVTAVHRHGHLQGAASELGVVMFANGETHQPPRAQVLDGGQVQLALVGGDLGQITTPLLVEPLGGKVPVQQIWGRHGPLVGSGRVPPAPPPRSSDQTLTGHGTLDGLLRHPLTRLP
jgi:hypothetical protein